MSTLAEREGVVVALEGRCGARLATVRLEAAPGCAGCGSRGTCASGVTKPQWVTVRVPDSVSSGEQVSLSMPEASIALASLLGYFLPTVGVMVGAVICGSLFSSDLAAVLGAVAGLGGGVLLARALAGAPLARSVTPSVCPSPRVVQPSGDLS